MNIHVTNLNINIIENDLQRLFTPFGEIKDIRIIRDKLNNRSRGRAFVDMPVDKEGENAIAGLNGTSFAGKVISLASVPYEEESDKRNTGLLND